jgi:hypothetical protein
MTSYTQPEIGSVALGGPSSSDAMRMKTDRRRKREEQARYLKALADNVYTPGNQPHYP